MNKLNGHGEDKEMVCVYDELREVATHSVDGHRTSGAQCRRVQATDRIGRAVSAIMECNRELGTAR